MGFFFGMQIKGAKEPWIKESAKNRMSGEEMEKEAGGEGIKTDQMAKEAKVRAEKAKVFKGLVELQLQLQGGPEHGSFQRAPWTILQSGTLP